MLITNRSETIFLQISEQTPLMAKIADTGLFGQYSFTIEIYVPHTTNQIFGQYDTMDNAKKELNRFYTSVKKHKNEFKFN